MNRTLGFRTCRTSTFYCVAKSATGATTISGLVSFGDVCTDGKVVRVSVVVDWLSMVQSWMYHESEPTPARREKARLNANEALRLQPDLRDILALGYSYYYGDRDYARALTEFEIAKGD